MRTKKVKKKKWNDVFHQIDKSDFGPLWNVNYSKPTGNYSG